ncbi:MAG: hypothetical protein SFV22_18165 [Saprospiraceae bacterium]|nr:hypothetical protein [Saprospiraceae bacterium]
MKSFIHTTAFAAFALFTGFFLQITPMKAQGCTLVCNDDLVVAVPANGTFTLLPQDLADTDLSVICPNGNFQTQAEINSIWTPASGYMIFDESHIGQTVNCRLRDLNSGNTCWGSVQVVELDTIHFQLCAKFWKNNRPIKGARLEFQPHNSSFPYAPMVFELDTSEHCVNLSIVPADYLPGTTFTYSAGLPDTGQLNGINMLDLCKKAKHILGVEPLESPYAMIAADVNRSGSITTFDLVESKKLILGIYTQFPNNTVWRFFPDYIQFPNPSNPFMTCITCPTSLTISELALLNGGAANVIGTKVGDVNGDTRLPGEAYIGPTPLDSAKVLLPQGQINAGATVTVSVKMNENISFGNISLAFGYDPAILKYDSISSEALMINPVSMAVFPDRLHFMYNSNSQDIFIPAGIPMYYMHFTVLQTAQMEDALELITNGDYISYALGSDCSSYVETGSEYAGFVSANTPVSAAARVQAPSPNPFVDQTFLEITLEQTEQAQIEIMDPTGRMLETATRQLPAGTTRWELPVQTLPAGSIGFWRLRIGDRITAGKIVRQ